MKAGYFIILFFIAAVGLSACKNNDEVFARVLYTNLNVIDASADTLNFYLNGTRQNNSSSLFPAGNSSYLSVPYGAQNYQFKKPGASVVLFSVPLTLTDSTYYSLYITGETTNDTFFTHDTLLTNATSDTSLVRFVNASPDAGNLDVHVGAVANYKSRAFKSSSVFLPVISGQEEVTIGQTGSGVLKVDTLITFQPGSTYTLFSKGLLNGKGNSLFDVGIIVN